MGESYMHGEFEPDDLTNMLNVMVQNVESCNDSQVSLVGLFCKCVALFHRSLLHVYLVFRWQKRPIKLSCESLRDSVQNVDSCNDSLIIFMGFFCKVVGLLYRSLLHIL